MALSASTIWEVQTGGSDTANGGAFDPSQTAGMFTDGAATVATSSAPVFTSASYNFVAGDIGAWVYIASGTNWTAGWYKITAVGSNAATLNGTIGQGVLKTTLVPSTVIGCATTASPTGATWTIDYSQQAGTMYAYTYSDLLSAGAGLTVSSALQPFGKQQVGNSIVITGGTNFNTGRYVIASVGAGPTFIATVVGPTNITTGIGANGTGGQGGALASVGQVGSVFLASNFMFIKNGSYSISSASTNISNGCFAVNASNYRVQGYGSVRGDMGTAPVITAISTISTFTVFANSSNDSEWANLTVNCSGYTTSKAFSFSRANGMKLFAQNCTNGGVDLGSGVAMACRATGCSSVTAITAGVAICCEAYSNTFTGISAARCIFSLSYLNTGATSDGFTTNTSGAIFTNCVAYANGRDGFRNTIGSGGYTIACINCIAEQHTASGAIGFNKGTSSHLDLINCVSFNNNTADSTGSGIVIGIITVNASPFLNAAGGNFALNNIAGAGASCRKAGFSNTFPAGTSVGYLDIGAVQAQWPIMPLNIANAI